MNRSGVGRTAREVLLTTGAVLGVVCIVMTIAGMAFGVKPLMFRSGSMSPAIHTGDLAFSRSVDASQLHKGDIVSVLNARGERVTHRLVSSAEQGNLRQLKLRGDANKTPDKEVYTVARVQRVMFDIPKAGYVVSAASSPAGVFVLGLYVALMLVLVFRKSPPQGGSGTSTGEAESKRAGSRKATPVRRGFHTRSAMFLAIASATVAASVAASGPTWAVPTPWTDSAGVTGTSLTAYLIPKPSLSCLEDSGLGIRYLTVSWTPPALPSGATLSYTALRQSNGDSFTIETVGSQLRVRVPSTLLALGTSVTVVVKATASFTGTTTTWTSASSSQTGTLVSILVGSSWTCGATT